MNKITSFVLVLMIIFSFLNTKNNLVYSYNKNQISEILINYNENLKTKSYYEHYTKLHFLKNNLVDIRKNISTRNPNYPIFLLIENKVDEFIFELLDKNISNFDNYEYQNLIIRLNNDLKYNLDYINERKKYIEDSFSIFLFRHRENISGEILINSINEIKKINPEIMIFIDQEGGLIRRYIDFDYKNISSYYNNPLIFEKYNLFDDDEKEKINELFSGVYFPGMKDIYNTFIEISENNKQNFLDLVAFVRLKNLSDHGINTHGLVLDLDKGNPVISGLGRSFSSDLSDYKKLIDSYIFASSITGVFLYAKHFPGHGDGEIDSHNDILVYNDNEKYLNDNLDLFEYFLDKNSKISKGIMVGHMYLPNSIKDRFLNILEKSDLILTDDLAMNGYKDSKSFSNDEMFFSTSEFLNIDKKIIKVDTQVNFK